MPRNLSIVPVVVPVKVPSSSLMVGLALFDVGMASTDIVENQRSDRHRDRRVSRAVGRRDIVFHEQDDGLDRTKEVLRDESREQTHVVPPALSSKTRCKTI